jgi:sulfonate transport system permease protein
MNLPIFIRRFFAAVLRGVSSYYRLAGPVILLLVWHIAAVAGWFDARVLPGPVAVITALGTSVSDGTLLPAVLVSLTRLLAGFLLGSALGVLLLVAGR